MVFDCGAKVSKYALLIINAFVWVVGVVLIIVGMLVIVQSDKYAYLFNNEENTLATAAGIVIGTGCFIFLVGFCACFGALKEVICLLNAYFALIVIIIILEITAAILAFVYRDGLTDIIGETMNEAVKNKYGKDKAATNAIDLVQKEFGCCGSTGYAEWAKSEWAREPTNTAPAPNSCCKNPKVDCNYDINNLNKKGCVDNFKDWLNSNYLVVGGVCLGLLIFEIMALVFTCVLLSALKEENEVV
ncbi:leukocyte surface antigen CD53-like [Amphiura filiformis]|uniref:leukocyte surface antigen CD53-like n=1 Tax=Amphiura filiformis TaxID=82378 RepID=UPI003B22503A